MKEPILVESMLSLMVGNCLIAVLSGTVVMLLRTRANSQRLSRKASDGASNDCREQWLADQRSRRLWVLLHICVLAPVMSLDRWLPWQIVWVCLYHIYMSLFANFLAQVHITLTLAYQTSTHATPPLWLGCYVPVMTLVVYAVLTNTLWIMGVADLFCAVSAVFCASAVCVLHTILWRRMKAAVAQARTEPPSPLPQGMELESGETPQKHQGRAREITVIDERGTTHEIQDLMQESATVEIQFLDSGPPTKFSYLGLGLERGPEKAVACLCLVVLGAVFQTMQGVAVVRTLGPFPGYSANLAEILTDVFVVFLICLQFCFAWVPFERDEEAATEKPRNEDDTIITIPEAAIVQKDYSSKSKNTFAQKGEVRAYAKFRKQWRKHAKQKRVFANLGKKNPEECFPAIPPYLLPANPVTGKWLSNATFLGSTRSTKCTGSGRSVVTAPLVARVSPNSSDYSPPLSDDDLNDHAMCLLSKLRATNDHQDLESYLMGDPCVEQWQERLCKVPESEQDAFIKRWIKEDCRSYVLFLALGSHLAQPYDHRATSILNSYQTLQMRMSGTRTESFERGSLAPLPRLSEINMLAEKAIFNKRFSWDRMSGEKSSFDSTVSSQTSDHSDLGQPMRKLRASQRQEALAHPALKLHRARQSRKRRPSNPPLLPVAPVIISIRGNILIEPFDPNNPENSDRRRTY